MTPLANPRIPIIVKLYLGAHFAWAILTGMAAAFRAAWWAFCGIFNR